MADKVVINLATGLEDTERVTVAFLVVRSLEMVAARAVDCAHLSSSRFEVPVWLRRYDASLYRPRGS